MTRDEFVPASEMELGEQVVALEGQLWRLTSITSRAGPESVYNFEVAGEHVYYVGSVGLLVHNLYVYAVIHKTKGVAYIGIGNAARKSTALARVATKLGYADESALRAAGSTLKLTRGNFSKTAARGLEQKLIQKAMDAGAKFTARGVKDGKYVHNSGTILNKVWSYSKSRLLDPKNDANTYEAAGASFWHLVSKWF